MATSWKKSDSIPVLFYIHGGAFFTGNNTQVGSTLERVLLLPSLRPHWNLALWA